MPAEWGGRAKDIKCNISAKKLALKAVCNPGGASESLLDGELYKPVDTDGSSWQLERESGQSSVLITLQKREPTKQKQHWPHVLTSDPAVETESFGPAVSTIDPRRPGSIKEAVRSIYARKKQEVAK